MTTPLDVAQTILGAAEGKDRAAIMDYLKTGGVNLDPATTAWCAAFVNSTLNQMGMSGTGSNMARSFLQWGNAVEGAPQPGDIGVWPRGDPNGPYGHVGFVESYDPKTGMVALLGGNQGNAVSVQNRVASDALGFRRGSLPDGPKGQEEYPRAAPPLAPPYDVADRPIADPVGLAGTPGALAAQEEVKPTLAETLGEGIAGLGAGGSGGGGMPQPYRSTRPQAARINAPPPIAPIEPAQMEQQRQQLALAMQRLNAGRLF